MAGRGSSFVGVLRSGRCGRCGFSTTHARRELLDVATLPDRIVPRYEEAPGSSLLSLHWPQPPRNVLIMPKLHAPHVTRSAIAFAQHLARNYPDLHLVFESRIAHDIHEALPVPVYTARAGDPSRLYPQKIDLVATLGGDGTILRAASLFSLQPDVPPILSFSMGTLGFLGEWKFDEYKRAWREVYMSGSGVAVDDLAVRPEQGQGTAAGAAPDTAEIPHDAGWGSVRGQSMGVKRVSRMLLRHRLKVGVYDQNGVNINDKLVPTSVTDASQGLLPGGGGGSGGIQIGSVGAIDAATTAAAVATVGPVPPRTTPAFHAINELLIHRGPHPHLAIIDIFLNNHFLTEAVADGILVSTPTGSTAYSLSAGGSIIHPLVSSLLLTPICPRSLSFRPLVLPLNTQIVLRLSPRNRGRELEVSIDGKRKTGVGIGMEVRVEGEAVGRTADGSWRGGVPCVIRAPKKGGDGNGVLEDDDGWVGGLNGLLKFNYPFGEVPP
ncbi:mitochondrial NADH kinase [Niveomyces insectorum RCEF 264]|uniref:Mitochondrial NADH kinase n=1 Tax=Niveomyces insectorum RCEF 264 TaxID=1081102 RepID=A0A162KBI1_9HYPO|nr:mitochondrial NADH kinase [Niveomyces insectorum RCEF 264]